jgi:hypothetical protein
MPMPFGLISGIKRTPVLSEIAEDPERERLLRGQEFRIVVDPEYLLNDSLGIFTLGEKTFHINFHCGQAGVDFTVEVTTIYPGRIQFEIIGNRK